MLKICTYWLLVLLSVNLLTACGSYQVKDIAKSHISMVMDVHRQTMDEHIFVLMEKLYKRNPRELRKQAESDIESQQERLRLMVVKEQPLLIDGLEDVEILKRGFNPAFEGDRVFQLAAGLMSMVHKSYGYRSDFYLFSKVDEQKLYHSARNLEIFSWRLRNTKGGNGELLLLSSALTGPVINLSFERLLSKMIAHQDMMALIAADGNKRTINTVAQGIFSVVFIPI